MSFVSREVETLRKNQNKMLEIKNTVMKMKRAGLISRFDTAKEKNH